MILEIAKIIKYVYYFQVRLVFCLLFLVCYCLEIKTTF